MSDDADLDALDARHQPREVVSFHHTETCCAGCGQAWPCDAHTLVAEARLAWAVLRAVEGLCEEQVEKHERHRKDAARTAGVDHRPCESASRAKFAEHLRAAMKPWRDNERSDRGND